MFNRKGALPLLLFVGSFLIASSGFAANKPNILVIMGDDIGQARTPRLRGPGSGLWADQNGTSSLMGGSCSSGGAGGTLRSPPPSIFISRAMISVV